MGILKISLNVGFQMNGHLEIAESYSMNLFDELFIEKDRLG